ncbi:MAG: primosomal protein N' [Gammaproteobacteria bacterium]|nr:MAG: primosomal protein N' [Gammaproteobacteria bacterium]
MARQARQRWPDQVALFHSGLSPAVRTEVWREMQSGRLRIVVGTRSAIFAPLPSLGLVCVDQEDDASLKEEQEPRYHARDVARMRAAQHRARLILGSSHPSLETWQDCGESRALTWQPPAPHIEVVDMRRQPYGTLLSTGLVDGIRAALDAGSRAVLFLNRKGFSTALLCRDCGQALRCPDCTVAFTYFRKAATLACRYCGLSRALPDVCPACQAARLEPVGSGTERLEEMLRRQFPGAVLTRLDRERARTPAKAEALRQEAAAGRWDILIGTQMLFQGSPLPPVGFVGVPQADDGLHVADFRAAERTYHALRDAADLALPAASGGRVVVQSHMPDHHAIAAVAGGLPALFYEQEMIFRQALGYPPSAHLISLRVSGQEAERVQQAAKRWARLLLAAIAAGVPGRHAQTTVLGPVPASHAQLRGRHRWQLLVKAGQADAGREAVKTTLEKLERTDRKGGLKFEVDVDPVEML